MFVSKFPWSYFDIIMVVRTPWSFWYFNGHPDIPLMVIGHADNSLSNNPVVILIRPSHRDLFCNFCSHSDSPILQRQFRLYIPFLGIARPQPQFPHSCVFERFIYSQDQSTYFLQQNRQTHPGNIHIIRSQTHECENWDWVPDIPFLRNICIKFSAFCLCSAWSWYFHVHSDIPTIVQIFYSHGHSDIPTVILILTRLFWYSHSEFPRVISYKDMQLYIIFHDKSQTLQGKHNDVEKYTYKKC